MIHIEPRTKSQLFVMADAICILLNGLNIYLAYRMHHWGVIVAACVLILFMAVHGLVHVHLLRAKAGYSADQQAPGS